MADEAVIVKMGLNRSAFDSGLRGARGALNTFKGALGALGLSFGFGQVTKFVGEMVEMAKALFAQSEAIGVSTDFLQGWEKAAHGAGVNAEGASGALNKLVKHLADTGQDGADVQQEILKLADAMKAQPDPIKRAQMALDAFGKSGIKMIPILMGGSKALNEVVNSANKLSSEDLEAIQKFGEGIAGIWKTIQVTGGKTFDWAFKLKDAFIYAYSSFNPLKQSGKDFLESMADATVQQDIQKQKADQLARPLREQAKEAARRNAIEAAYVSLMDEQTKNAFEETDAATQLNALLEFRRKLIGELSKNPERSVASAKKLLAVEQASHEIAKKQKEVDEARTKALEKQAQATEKQVNAQEKLSKVSQSISDAKGDRSSLTLQELSERTPLSFGGLKNKWKAQQIIQLEENAKTARAEGRPDMAEGITQRALELRKGLQALPGHERDPLGQLNENMAEAADQLKTLTEAATGEGINIIPRNGA